MIGRYNISGTILVHGSGTTVDCVSLVAASRISYSPHCASFAGSETCCADPPTRQKSESHCITSREEKNQYTAASQ